jgi:hypothetical protein
LNTDNTNLIIKIVLPGVILLALILIVAGFILAQKKSVPAKTATEQWAETTEQMPDENITPNVSMAPLITSTASESALVARINELTKQVATFQTSDAKIDNMQKQIDDLNRRLSKYENPTSYSVNSPSPGASAAVSSSAMSGPQYIYALGYGGSTTSTDWTEIPSMTIAFDPTDYPGYKSLQLEVYMHVRDGNGQAFARLYTSGTAATSSQVSSTNYQDEWVNGGNFTWNTAATFTIQIKSLNGYDAYISNARIKINF